MKGYQQCRGHHQVNSWEGWCRFQPRRRVSLIKKILYIQLFYLAHFSQIRISSVQALPSSQFIGSDTHAPSAQLSCFIKKRKKERNKEVSSRSEERDTNSAKVFIRKTKDRNVDTKSSHTGVLVLSKKKKKGHLSILTMQDIISTSVTIITIYRRRHTQSTRTAFLLISKKNTPKEGVESGDVQGYLQCRDQHLAHKPQEGWYKLQPCRRVSLIKKNFLVLRPSTTTSLFHLPLPYQSFPQKGYQQCRNRHHRSFLEQSHKFRCREDSSLFEDKRIQKEKK